MAGFNRDRNCKQNKVEDNTTSMAPIPQFYTRDNYLEHFEELTCEMLNLTAKKNSDYGGHTNPFKNFQDFGELGILVRMSDKLSRLRTAIFDKRELKVADEQVDDTILDLAVYSLILILYRRHKDEVNKSE